MFFGYFLDCGSGVGYCGYFPVGHAIDWLVRVLVLPLFGCCACGLLCIGSLGRCLYGCFVLRVVFSNVAGLWAL